MALKQYLSHKLEQRLSPQQIQLMKLLQVPTMELDQRIKQELEENPALEEGAEVDEAKALQKAKTLLEQYAGKVTVIIDQCIH